jgi:hypothetical protein
MIDLIAVAHEGYPYGYLQGECGIFRDDYLATVCFVTEEVFNKRISELILHKQIQRDPVNGLYVPEMVESERIRQARGAGGVKGGNPKLVGMKVNHQGSLEGKPRSDSDSIDSKTLEKKDAPNFEDDFEAWFETIYQRHPRKKFKHAAMMDLKQLIEAGKITREQFDERHAAWCATEAWRWKQGASAPDLSQFILDDGWKYHPLPEMRQAPRRAVDDAIDEIRSEMEESNA